MKITTLIIFTVLFFTSCSEKPETRLEAFNAEAFAFQVDTGWEVNSSIRVKGFQQRTSDSKFISKLSYNVGIVTPAKDTISNIAANEISHSQNEEVPDIPVEVQIELDSSYAAGKYLLLFNIKDELSGKAVHAVKELDLE